MRVHGLEYPRAWGEPAGSALVRCCPEDFRVSEELGFEPSGEGEHVFLHLQKRRLNTLELVQRLCALGGVAPGQVGYSGLKDRNAVTRQWFSVGLAGRPEPDWGELERDGDVQVLAVNRHRRKLRRGVHKANRFALVLRQLEGERPTLESRLQLLRDNGVPNYFGEQRFGRNGSTYVQALRWMRSGRRVSREKRGLYLSALRAHVFNTLLARRVDRADWNVIHPGDVSLLHGTRSYFVCDVCDDDIRARVAAGDLHPGLPLWGKGTAGDEAVTGIGEHPGVADGGAGCAEIRDFLESSGMVLAWRPARLMPDDFCWQFCDDGTLRLDFALGAGSYATALLAELVRYKEKEQYQEGKTASGRGSEQD